ncbi:hypothetical protein HU200_000542 [Digitaria exilis]|uniref:FCP1 homology domain-containing protein n=1 Tax=Digitaria exilis TaxID=1010633 RepID=A0A835G1E9_9POAL|nr:hypothetical protein HU200_000542 [Digitaria exilis]
MPPPTKRRSRLPHPGPHSSIAAKGWLSSVRRDPSSRPRRSEDDGTPLPDEISSSSSPASRARRPRPWRRHLQGCRRWHRLVSGEAAFICRRAMKLPGSGVKFLPPLAVGFFHHHPNAAAPRFVPMASASRRSPSSTRIRRTGLVVVELRRGKHDMPALKLCVCNPMTGHVHALPPLTDKDSLRHYACTVITSDDYYDGGGERRRSTSTYRLLLVYSRRGFTAFRIYSSDDGSWSSETKVTGARLSRKQMRLTRSGVVARGGHAAYWLAKNLVFGLRLDTLEASVATCRGLVMASPSTKRTPCMGSHQRLDLPRRPAATSGKTTMPQDMRVHWPPWRLAVTDGRRRRRSGRLEPFSVLDGGHHQLEAALVLREERGRPKVVVSNGDDGSGGNPWRGIHGYEMDQATYPGDTPPRVHSERLGSHATPPPHRQGGQQNGAAAGFQHPRPFHFAILIRPASAPSAPVPDPNPPPHLPRPPLASPGGSAPAAMSEVKQGGDDGRRPALPPAPWEEDTEGGAPELSIGDDGEMKVPPPRRRRALPPAPGIRPRALLPVRAKGRTRKEVLPNSTIEGRARDDDDGSKGWTKPPPRAALRTLDSSAGSASCAGRRRTTTRRGAPPDSLLGTSTGLLRNRLRRRRGSSSRAATLTWGTSCRERKLTLILDLDHTLLNSTALDDFSPAEVRNGFSPTTVDDLGRGLFRLDGHGIRMLTKLRRSRKASGEGERHAYARAVVSLLDPYAVYFGERIVSKAESTEPFVKSLDVHPRRRSRRRGDPRRFGPDNLILMDRYHYFASTCRNYGYDTSSMAEQNCDAREHDGSLAVALQVLRRVHQLFFDSVVDGYFPDVRQVIAEVRREVLRGCTVVFSRLNYLEDFAEDTPISAPSCKVDVDETVTHVVAEHPGTEKAQWARDNDKFLVNWKWIQAAKFRWCRQEEQYFPVLLGD